MNFEANGSLFFSHGTLWQLNAEILAGARSAELDGYGAALGTAVGLLEHALGGAAPALGGAAAALRARTRARLDAAEAAAPRDHRPALAAGFVAGALTRERWRARRGAENAGVRATMDCLARRPTRRPGMTTMALDFDPRTYRPRADLLSGRVIMVTGAGAGIGRAVRALARASAAQPWC